MAGYTASSDGTTAGTWYTWVTDGTATTNASGSTWNQWIAADFSATTSTSATSNVWVAWNNETQYVVKTARVVATRQIYAPAPETEEQKQARLVREAEWKRQEAERKQKEAEALQRAEDLLMLQLSERQKSDWKEHKAFDVISQSGKRFRITNRSAHNVFEYDKDGKRAVEHCIVSREHVPLPDQLVMQKLMLENHEADFMRIANHTRLN
jgi:hypothetical protein